MLQSKVGFSIPHRPLGNLGKQTLHYRIATKNIKRAGRSYEGEERARATCGPDKRVAARRQSERGQRETKVPIRQVCPGGVKAEQKGTPAC